MTDPLRQRQIERERKHTAMLRQRLLNEGTGRAAEGVATSLVQHAYGAIREDLATISAKLLDGQWDEAAAVWGTSLGGIQFRRTRKLHPIWHYLQHPSYAPNSSPVEDVCATAISAVLALVLGKPPTLMKVLSGMSRELSHMASMAFIYRFQSREAVTAIKERARSRKLAIPMSAREALERRTAIETLGSEQVRVQLERHADPEDPFKIDGVVSVRARGGGWRRISVKKTKLPTKMDWGLLDLCGGTGREWDSVAMIVLGLFIKHTGMVELVRKAALDKRGNRKGRKRAIYVSLVGEAQDTLVKGVDAWLETLNAKEPMICPPEDGSYLTTKNRAVTYRKKEARDDDDRPLLTRARGTVQWKEVVRGMAETPFRVDVPKVARLRALSLAGSAKTAPAKFAKEAAMLGVAGRAAEGEAIWFPVVMDTRGRTYYKPTPWNPQTTDLGKAMLTARGGGVPRTEKDWREVYLALRGIRGTDKNPIPETSNPPAPDHGRFCQLAMKEAEVANRDGGDEPYQCAVVDVFDPGQLYQLDGTCNGLQHLCAMMEDRAAGATVNLCDHPGEFRAGPADIYKDIADKLWERLCAMEEPWARRLVASGLKLTRKFTKRQVMVIPYGAGEPTIKNLTRKALLEQADELDFRLWQRVEITPGVPDEAARQRDYSAFSERPLDRHPLFKNDANRLGKLMADMIREEVLPGAFELMQVLKAFAKEANGRAIAWRVRDHKDSLWAISAPIKRYASHNRTIGLHLPGMAQRLLQYGLRTDEGGRLRDADQIDKSAVTKGLVPNFVHSHDADHMARVAGRMAELGHPFAAIHDCFLSTGSGMGDLARVTREEFVAKYRRGPDHPFAQPVRFLRSADTPEELLDKEWPSWYEAVEDVLGLEARQVLEKSRGLDVRSVLDSPFFFC